MKDWGKIVQEIDFAFQPIVNPVTGHLFAVESLIRGFETHGFLSINELLNTAYVDNVITHVDLELQEKAIKKYMTIPYHKKIRLFINLDPRILEIDCDISKKIIGMLRKLGLKPDLLCYEINEKHQISSIDTFKDFLIHSTQNGIKIAIDDFGSGFAGLELFYHSDPHYIKFDRFLIQDINHDIKKKTFCTHIINLSKFMGVITLAEGIETKEEYFICKELGFDLFQGYYLQKPELDISKLNFSLPIVQKMNNFDKRKYATTDAELISKEIIKLETMSVDDSVQTLFDKFKTRQHYTFFPLVDSHNVPVGILHENDIKKYVYAPFGKEVLLNRSINISLISLARKAHIVDLYTPEEKILEIFASDPDSDGLIVTDDMKYYGFLTTQSLLTIINQKNLLLARELNPLTKLPGNIMIESYISRCYLDTDYYNYLVYLDFDYFKPFNDKFGFRQGDKVITIFSDILKKMSITSRSVFLGHIGGDDFFVGFRIDDKNDDAIIDKIQNCIDSFNDKIAAFFDKQELKRKTYFSCDRHGIEREFPLLSVSAAIICLNKRKRNLPIDAIARQLSLLKQKAKRDNVTKIFCEELD